MYFALNKKFTDGSFLNARHLNDIVDKIVEIGGYVGVKFSNRQKLCADKINQIIISINNLILQFPESNIQQLELLNEGDVLCALNLNTIVDKINEIIDYLNNKKEEVYGLTVNQLSTSRRISSSGGNFILSAYITKNRKFYTTEGIQVISDLNYTINDDVITFTIPKNEANEKIFNIKITSEYGEEDILLYQDSKEIIDDSVMSLYVSTPQAVVSAEGEVVQYTASIQKNGVNYTTQGLKSNSNYPYGITQSYTDNGIEKIYTVVFSENLSFKEKEYISKISAYGYPSKTVSIIQQANTGSASVNSYIISYSGNNVISNTTLPIMLDEGSFWSGTFQATNGYKIDDINYTGQNVNKSGNTINVNNLISNIHINVLTSPIQHTISWNGNHATISGQTSPITQDENSSWTGTIISEDGYRISNIEVVGNNVNINDNIISISNLINDVTITIYTELIQIFPTSINVVHDTTLNPGQTQQLTAIVLPEDTTNKSITWSSENNNIATVNNSGLVTAQSVGKVKIYATSNMNSNIKGYATITVVAIPVTRYNISWSGDHASIPGVTSPIILEENSNWSGTFVPDSGYKIDNITYSGNNISRNGNTININDLTSDIIISISTSKIQHTISWSGEHFSMTRMNPTISNGGSLDEGSSWTVTIVAEEGYQIDNITTTGENVIESNNIINISNLTTNVTINIITSEIYIEPTLIVDDKEITVGQEIYVSWSLSDSSYTINKIEYEIDDTNIAEITGDEPLYKKVIGKSKGKTTVTVTINDTITSTGTITVINVFDVNPVFGTREHPFDIFGNKSPLKSSYDRQWHTAIPDGQPNADWDGVITKMDSANEWAWDIPGNLSNDELQYISDHMELIDTGDGVSWITVHIEEYNVVCNVDPWYEKIEDLKNIASNNTQYAQFPDGNVIKEVYGGTTIQFNKDNSDYPVRTCIIRLTSSDGSSIDIPVKQCCVYGGRYYGGGGSDNKMLIEASSNNIWSSIDWYGPEGSNFTSNRTWSINRNSDVKAFAVINPASSVQGITGLPSVIVTNLDEDSYDPTFIKLYETQLI